MIVVTVIIIAEKEGLIFDRVFPNIKKQKWQLSLFHCVNETAAFIIDCLKSAP